MSGVVKQLEKFHRICSTLEKAQQSQHGGDDGPRDGGHGRGDAGIVVLLVAGGHGRVVDDAGVEAGQAEREHVLVAAHLELGVAFRHVCPGTVNVHL